MPGNDIQHCGHLLSCGRVGANYLRADFIVLMGFQPSMAREELMWAIGANSTSRGESAGRRAGPGWDWGRWYRKDHPWAGQGTCGQVGRARSAGSSSELWGFIERRLYVSSWVVWFSFSPTNC